MLVSFKDEGERPMSPTTISDNISVNNFSSAKETSPQSPAGDKDVNDPGDLAAALLDPKDALDTASIKGVSGESCV